jgi:hypothetical protein
MTATSAYRNMFLAILNVHVHDYLPKFPLSEGKYFFAVKQSSIDS